MLGLWHQEKGACSLLTLAMPAWLVNKVGQEMGYQVYESLSYALLSIRLLRVGYDL